MKKKISKINIEEIFNRHLDIFMDSRDDTDVYDEKTKLFVRNARAYKKPLDAYPYLNEAIREIVEAVIDKCASDVLVGVIPRKGRKIKGTSSKYVGIMDHRIVPDKQSILNVKNMIEYEQADDAISASSTTSKSGNVEKCTTNR